MSRKQAIALSIIETLSEREDGAGLPEGHMFAALMGLVGLSEFRGILAGLERVGLVGVSHNYVTATSKAREMIKNGRAK